MKICEIFRSIQGEGLLVGTPTTFVRTWGCNLDCTWCDTRYARKDGGKKEIELGDILKRIDGFNTSYVCITGGEPLTQKERVYELIDMLVATVWIVVLETNGSIDIEDTPIEDNLMISMDYKLPSSGMQASMIERNVDYLGPVDQLKFPIMNREDYETAKTIIESHEIRSQIVMQPVWGSNMKDIVEWILKDSLDVRFIPQVHKMIWGEERGR